MKKIKETMKFSTTIRSIVWAVLIVTVLPVILFSSQMDQNLVDDVTAMITNAKKLSHTSFIIDTSESMNSFAYSDYVDTCADSISNISKAIVLCVNAYNQCRNVEANAMCDVDLGCADISNQCNDLQGTKLSLQNYCAEVNSIYGWPPLDAPTMQKDYTVSPPILDNKYAKKFVGPWNPQLKYNQDLCFYDWTADTGGQVLGSQTSGHYTNPNNGSGYTDRRDWDCLTDGVKSIKQVHGVDELGGLWLNWKYTTSLDAVKIILGNVHEFSYSPRARGQRKCQLTKYYPYKVDHILGRICYQEFQTNPATIGELNVIAEHVRNNWTKVVDDNSGAYYDDALCSASAFTVNIDTDTCAGCLVPSDTLPKCDVCLDINGNTISCEQYAVDSSETGKITDITGITTTVDYSCCINYTCSDPKCRDDDSTCRTAVPGGGCVLGYYSDFDQDQSHCCDILSCVENDPGMAPGVCPSGAKYLPGPGNDSSEEYEDTLAMTPLSGTDTYKDAKLMAKVRSLDFGSNPANVSKVVISVYYGCNTAGEKPSIKIGEKTFTSAVAADEDIFAAPMDLTGCDTSGYKVGGAVTLYHSGASFTPADITADLRFSLDYTSGSDANINVLRTTDNFYSEYISEATGLASERVNEYECKTTFYHKQTLVVSGGSGNCPAKHPSATRCVEPDHTKIAQDQWGTVTKTACSWLCRDEEVYDDVWKCRGFFAQMDNTARGGSGLCTGVCPGDNPANLEACCSCIDGSAYQYKNLEPPENVWFGASTVALGGRQYNCSVSGYEEGITSEGKRTYTSAYMAEVVEGHIKELGDSSYRLNPAGYVSPYTATEWYAPLSLIQRSNSFLKESFVSVFETGKNDTRDIACVYDLVSSFEGEDCADDCGTGCCSIDIGGGTDYCDYPNFWMKIPNTEGGKLIFPAKTLSGAEIIDFQNTIKALKAKGGSTLGETLFDLWRYLGGMYAAHDPNYTLASGNLYPTPFQGSAKPECFINDAVIISGGQPQFDDNSSIKDKTTQGTNCVAHTNTGYSNIPCIYPDAADVYSEARPYVRENWYLSSFKNVANFVHTKDFWHEDSGGGAFCRIDNNVNMFGYEVGGTAASGHDCTPATDTTGLNVIDSIHTVAIGEWTLSAMYGVINPTTGYLDSSILEEASTNNNGMYFGLTTQTPKTTGDIRTFHTLTEMFNKFNELGSDQDLASGRPHWTSSLVQPLDVEEKVRGPEAYNPVTIPIDNSVSRFWFGNLKKYTIDDGSSGCNMEVSSTCGAWESITIPEADCFYLSDTGGDITDPRFALLNAGGAAKKIEDRLLATAPTCDGVVGSSSPCFTSGARNILYDDGFDILELKTAAPAWFTAQFQLANPTITLGQAIQIIDYIYGYNAFGEYPADMNQKNAVRFATMGTILVDDPFDIDFGGTNKIAIRPLLLGAITHSKPLAVYYEDTSTTRIFAGANDGMLHSFDQDGNETFAYIPKPVLPAITSILSGRNGIFFNAAVDGPITLFHIDQSNDGIINDGEKAYLIFGYRRGAKGYTVIDVSKRDDPKFVQHINTEGYSFAQAKIFRKCGAAECRYAGDLTYYLAVPGGYDTCHDTDTPLCLDVDGLGNLDPDGNVIYIYKFNGTTEKFDIVKQYDPTTPASNPLTRDTEWMRTSFASTPIPLNTSSKLTVGTEFVYFSDISSTVFRLDVRDNDPANWKFRSVFRQRGVVEPVLWTAGVRTYTASNVFPPMIKFPSYTDSLGNDVIPVPLITGNMANPAISETDEMIVYYDKKNFGYFDPPLDQDNLKNASTDLTGCGTSPCTGFDGWKYPFLSPRTEKGVTDPLIVFDMYENNDYRLAWNTYVPNELVDCKNFGTSRNYEKILVDGQNIVDKWDPSDACGMEEISIATSVGMIATATGYDMTFGAGHQIFKKPQITIQANVTNIIKWYELY